MLMPGKSTALHESTLYKMTDIVEILRNGSLSVTMLYEKLRDQFDGIKDYMDALDCLYMLGRISIGEGGMLHVEQPVDH